MLGICIPTRGFIFSKVMEAVEEIQESMSCHVYISSDLQVPRAFNVLTQKALHDRCDRILYIEEDTVPPENIVPRMQFALDADPLFGAATVDYPLANGNSTIVKKETLGISSSVLWCGLGCTLVRKEVFMKLSSPYFRSDTAFFLNKNEWGSVDPSKQYGLYDVNFFCDMRRKGFSIVQVSGRCEHLKIETMGDSQINGGVHKIVNKSEDCNPSFIDVDPNYYWPISNVNVQL